MDVWPGQTILVVALGSADMGHWGVHPHWGAVAALGYEGWVVTMASPARSGKLVGVGETVIGPQGRRARQVGGRLRRLEVKLTEDELAALRAKAESAGVSIQRYLVDSALSADRPPALDLRRSQMLLVALRGEVGKLGGNLNQLAKVANSTGLIPAGLRDATERVPKVEAKILAALAAMTSSAES